MLKFKKWEYVLIIGLIFVLSGIVYSQVCRSEKLTITNSPTALTASVYGRARYGFGVLETAKIMWTTDPNITVTTTLGLPLEIGQNITLDTSDKIRNFRAVRVGSTSGTLQILYFD